ncbi:MAG TPA: hypothetical protein VF120_07410 [Ktedonobacterales bacterium]
MERAPGTVIFINGPSSVGKTSVAKALQAILGRPYLRMGIDEFLPCVPDGLVQLRDQQTAGEATDEPSTYVTLLYRRPTAHLTAAAAPSAAERRLVGMRIGPEGLRFFGAMYHAMAAMAHYGVDLIVDTLIHEPRELREAVLAFRELPVLLVGLRAPREVIERREQTRGDRQHGLGLAFYESTHANAAYDLEFDTSTMTAHACAQQIKQALDEGHPRAALSQLAAALDA